MQCDVHYAKTNTSKLLLKQAEAGEEVFITRSGQRFRIEVVSRPKPKFGTLQAKVKPVKESLLFAMSDAEADAFYRRQVVTMPVLLDTHIAIWLATEPNRVCDHLQKLVLEADWRYISVVSFFEVAMKHRKDPDAFPFTFELLAGALGDLQAMELPLRKDHISRVGTIPFLHKDPVDHLLISQAIEERLVVITMDHAITSYYGRFNGAELGRSISRFCDSSGRKRSVAVGARR